MLCLPELLCNLLPGEKRGVAGGGHNGVVGAHAAVGVVGRDHLLQNVDDLVAVVQGRVLEPLQVGVEFSRSICMGGAMKILLWAVLAILSCSESMSSSSYSFSPGRRPVTLTCIFTPGS